MVRAVQWTWTVTAIDTNDDTVGDNIISRTYFVSRIHSKFVLLCSQQLHDINMAIVGGYVKCRLIILE